MDYKDTLNLPKTAFPMKANLPKLEPEMLARWEEMDIYERIRQASAEPSAVDPARRSAVRQRPHPHGDRAQQDLKDSS